MGAQTATILVTDLVGSTELRVALGEERAEEVRRAHDRMLTDLVAEGGGTLIKGLGDGVLASFTGAAEAVSAAATMQQGAESLARREHLNLAIRVGISSGDVTFEDGDSFGTPVVEASRLCAAAEGGQILVADVVRVLARGRGGHEFTPVGPLELKGLPEPVDAVSVAWEPVRTPGDLRARAPFVGRAAEREVLVGRLAAAAAGEGGLVLVAGEPGIGKTRLVTEVCHEVAAGQAVPLVLLGGCHDGEVSAYAPFVEALTDWARRTPSEHVAEALGPEASVLGRLVPALHDALPGLGEPLPIPAEEATARLHDAVIQLLGRLAAAQPVVLILDDLHWADGGTVGLLRAVARRARRDALLVVGTYRDTDLDRRHPLSEALPLLRREVEPTRIALDGLGAADVRQLLEQLADHEVPDAFAALLARQTDGNPFFLRELLIHLTAAGQLRFEDGVWVAEADIALAIPEGVREVVGRRVSQLSDAANRLLTVGALFEVGFPLTVAADVAGLAEDEALDAVDEALAARIVQPADVFDHYVFTHALFRQTLEGELNPSRQVRSHRAIAEALEKTVGGEPTPAQIASLARHWYQSSALPGSERGVPYAVALAEASTARYAHSEAQSALAMALELIAPDDEREQELRVAHLDAMILATASIEDVAREFERLGTLLASTEGQMLAADRMAESVHQAFFSLDRSECWRLAAIARQWLDPERRDRTWLTLRLAELDEADFADPNHPGIPLDSPERRETQAVNDRLPYAERDITFLAPSTRTAALAILADQDAEGADDLSVKWGAMWVAADLRRIARVIDPSRDELRRSGQHLGVAMNAAIVTRSLTILGEHDRADAVLREGIEILDRIPADSNPAFQVLAAVQLQAISRGALAPTSTAMSDSVGDNPGTRWAALAVTAVNAVIRGQVGATDQALADLDRVMVGIERAAGWALNYVLLICSAVECLWLLDRTDHLDIIEANLRTKVLEPDLRYAEVDARLAMAQIAALRGAPAEARDWFARARSVLADEGAETLLVKVDHDEALMELRLGADGSRARFDGCVASARSGCGHPAMAPWLTRLDALEEDAAAIP